MQYNYKYGCISVGEIAEAFKLSNAEFRQKYGAPLPPKDVDDMVVYCRSGVRAANACQELIRLDYLKYVRLCGDNPNHCYMTSSSSSCSHLLWGRCGRHNSPPASSVMDFFFCCCPDSAHVSVDTVHPSLL